MTISQYHHHAEQMEAARKEFASVNLNSIKAPDELRLWGKFLTARQTALFEAERPGVLECSGPDLPATLADLRARGGVVFAMSAITSGRWRLHLHWPAPRQMSLTDQRCHAHQSP